MLLTVSLLSCTSVPPAGSNSNNTGTSATGSSPAPSGGKVSLLTWTNPSTVKYLEGMAERLKAATGITLEITSVDSNSHVGVRQTRLMAKDVDIVTWVGGFVMPVTDWNKGLMDEPDYQGYIESGLLYDLTDQPFIQNYDKDVLTSAYGYNGKIYALMGGTVPFGGLYYNIDRFNELGIKIPETWDEFIAMCEKIKAAGYEPITCGAADQWPLNQYAQPIVTNVLLEEQNQVAQDLFLGKKKFTDPDMVQLFKMREEFCSYMEPGVVGIPYSDSFGRFASEKALMYADGIWSVNDIKAANPSFEFGYFPLPGIEKRSDGLPTQMVVKYDFAMSVVANSPNRDNALEVLKFFSDKNEYSNFIEQVGFYPSQPGVTYENAFLKSLEPYMKKPMLHFPKYAPKGVGQNGANGGCNMFLFSAVGGAFNYEELAQAVQEDWDNARASVEKVK